MNTYHYTYFITNLKPTSDEKYYIGVHSGSIEPELDTKYMGSSLYLDKDLNEHFKKEILEVWPSRELAEAHEAWMHGYIDVAKHHEYYNRRNANIGWHATPESSLKQKLTRRTQKWRDTNGKDASKKRAKTRSKSSWKEKIGKPAYERKVIADAKTKSDPEWQSTVGAKIGKNISETKSSKEWKESVGKECNRKHSETLNSPEYIKAHTFECPHCGRSIRGKSLFNRWHNDNCKDK